MTKKIYRLTKISLMAALLCVISPFAFVFPFSPVPVSLATLMLYLSVYILGKRDAVISCGIYLLIGLIGIPVFSGFSGGIGKVLGPTGGYMLGYLALTFISGWVVDKCNGRRKNSVLTNEDSCYVLWGNRVEIWLAFFMQGIGMVFGTVVCYLFGSLWLAYQAGMNFKAALGVGAIPFIPGDVVKIVIGVIAGNVIRKRLMKAGVM